MTPKLLALKPQDVAVALRLAVNSSATYAELGADLSLSASTAHESVERLRLAGLLRPESLQPNRHALLEFFEHGLRYVFPARLESRGRGVPTAWSGPALAGDIVADDVIVWASPHGTAYGLVDRTPAGTGGGAAGKGPQGLRATHPGGCDPDRSRTGADNSSEDTEGESSRLRRRARRSRSTPCIARIAV